MSYSLKLRAVSKLALIAAVAAQLDEIAVQQPPHEKDKGAANAAAAACINVLPDDETKDVEIAMGGSINTRLCGPASEMTTVTGASVSVSAYLVDRPATD